MRYFLGADGGRGFWQWPGEAHRWILEGYPRPALHLLCRILQEAFPEGDTVLRSLDGKPLGVVIHGRYIGCEEQGFSYAAISGREEYALYQQEREEAHRLFRQALLIHDQWEGIYYPHMHLSALDRVTDTLVQQTIGDQRRPKVGRRWDRFLGAATAWGAVDYIEELTKAIPRRFLIEGRPGTGKSTLLKQLASFAQGAGFDVEVYHCAFDPHSLDMVIIRELELCAFDNTAPHSHPHRDAGDEVVDLYALAVEEDTDTRYRDQLEEVSSQYRETMAEATGHLQQAEAALTAYEATLPYDPEAVEKVAELFCERLS